MIRADDYVTESEIRKEEGWDYPDPDMETRIEEDGSMEDLAR